jgi:hypothetical protein
MTVIVSVSSAMAGVLTTIEQRPIIVIVAAFWSFSDRG